MTTKYSVELPTQYSAEEFEELEAKIRMAVKVGVSLSVGQIIILFSSGQLLKASWPLINTFQFIVYIGMWKIDHTDTLVIIHHEL